MSRHKVIDVFAGPGGLNEGFASLEGGTVFDIAGSFEMDDAAISTLTTRATQRILQQDGAGSQSHRRLLRGEIDLAGFRAHADVEGAWAEASAHVHQVELGPSTRVDSDALISSALGKEPGPWVLIGGPPCQAYSLAGRSRRVNDAAFEDDVKHFLYREYLNILERFQPSVFVMENVKGMLSTTHGGTRLFDRILSDLSRVGRRYRIRSLTVKNGSVADPRDFVVRAEHHGVPQARHRVILVGIRDDLPLEAHRAWRPLERRADQLTVRDALSDLPALRSRLTPKGDDSWDAWARVRAEAFAAAERPRPRDVAMGVGGPWVGSVERPVSRQVAAGYLDWVRRDIGGFAHHETRGHMAADLRRYAYLANLATEDKVLSVHDLPEAFRPSHANIGKESRPFADRFRVQRWGRPSSTVVSHLAKDGHYFIHPDPDQMRSVTVREAARLQSFPDDYWFAGNRTKQYQQVGNAVPPFLARQIASRVADVLDRA
ncbi:hypothetical protein BJF82_02495 [Kytococcus sp. CUA-901]|nr:hypothetical protein BJF82_02495 [Kytococcus sp. CUA-901]